MFLLAALVPAIAAISIASRGPSVVTDANGYRAICYRDVAATGWVTFRHAVCAEILLTHHLRVVPVSP